MNRNLENMTRYVGYGLIGIIMMVVFRLVMPKANGSIGIWLAAIYAIWRAVGKLKIAS
mgnify:CR=1 FL=1